MRRGYVELHELEPGARFRFFGFPDQVAVLVEKGPGRAMIRYARARAPEARTFQVRDRRTGERVARTIAVNHGDELAPCALGAQVVPLAARDAMREGA